MPSTANNEVYSVASWLTGLAALLVLLGAVLSRRSQAEARSAVSEVPDLRTRPLFPSFLKWATVLLILAVLPPLLSGGFGALSKDRSTHFDERFFFLVFLDSAIVVAGCLMAIPVAKDRLTNLPPILFLFGAVLGLLHAWSTFEAGRLPRLWSHSCAQVQVGRECPLEVRGGRGWSVVGGGVLRYDTPGPYTPHVRLRHGLATVEGDLRVQVGEDRGSPLFLPRTGDVWHFEYVQSGASSVLFVLGNRRSARHFGELTMRAASEHVALGRRWIRLEFESGEQKKTRWAEWAFFWNGQTLWTENRAKDWYWPASPPPGWDWDWSPEWQDEKLRPAANPLDGEPLPRPEDEREADKRERVLARVPEPGPPLDELSVPCEFGPLDLSCRCAPRGLGQGRTLPGPFLCHVDSSGLKTALLMVMTAGSLIHTDRVDLLLTESLSETGLAPPAPPLVELTTGHVPNRDGAGLRGGGVQR